MNKTDLIAVAAASAGVSKKDAAAVIDAAIDAITSTLAQGEGVRLAGFGTFEVHERAARETLNPQTGERVTIAPYRAPAFKPAKALKAAVNEGEH